MWRTRCAPGLGASEAHAQRHEQHQRHHRRARTICGFPRPARGRPCRAFASRGRPGQIVRRVAQQFERLPRRFRRFRGIIPHCAACSASARRLVALSSTIKIRKSASLGWRVSSGGRGLRLGLNIHGEMKCRAFARHAFRPHFSAHQFHQPFADGQSQSRAAVMSRGRNIRLHERLEQPRQFVRRDADARVAHGKMQVQQRTVCRAAGLRGKQFDLDKNVARSR